MNSQLNSLDHQITFGRQLIYHFYPGILITLFYLLLSPYLIDKGIPGLGVLIIAEVAVLAPVALGHLSWQGFKLNGRFSWKDIILYQNKLSWKQYLLWTVLGMVLILLIYVPLYPVGLWLRANAFSWLPEWYFNPSYGAANMDIVANTFLIGILIDGFVGPIVEELYFRGYLLPRMQYLKKWAPVVNGLFFGLYHFWQPHNFIATSIVGIILSYIVWKKKNVYLGILIHCILNVLGSASAYFAISAGIDITR